MSFASFVRDAFPKAAQEGDRLREKAAHEGDRLRKGSEGAQEEIRKNRFLQDCFRMARRIYATRGYAGTIFVSGQFGVYTESVSVTIPLADTVAPVADNPELAAINTKLASDDSQVFKLIRSLLRRMETRADQWREHDDVDPEIGSQGSIGFTLPFVNVGWAITVSLTVKQSTLLRYMEFKPKLPAGPELLAAAEADPDLAAAIQASLAQQEGPQCARARGDGAGGASASSDSAKIAADVGAPAPAAIDVEGSASSSAAAAPPEPAGAARYDEAPMASVSTDAPVAPPIERPPAPPARALYHGPHADV